ncbi:ammonia-forming cytochrome c nitrite reductase subunit c552 [Endozoicomonas numazuensis]|uniref:ammonia-forming cytochrome c nitrite reductase subunit c552 n=1 Tax=Endozoicomonas numazuensis TaxID=1137799 RepID=UPI00191C4466|nr:ammonia-forming cytochrome c nitrite reductase subunit c552 [Endozoicomonas numazuensis]
MSSAGKWTSMGHEIVNPIGCIDCHDTRDTEMLLRISRPWLNTGLSALNYE